MTTSSQTTRVLFLDFDGVLHPTTEDLDDDSGRCLATPFFGWLPHLARALEWFLDVRIVVHSTWRYTQDVDELRELLGPLRVRFLGATPRGPRNAKATRGGPRSRRRSSVPNASASRPDFRRVVPRP